MTKRAFITVITRSYLPYARVLARSIRQFHDDPIYVLFLDDFEGLVDPTKEPFICLRLSDVLPESLSAMKFYYSVFELCCAVRPFLHRYIQDKTDATEWLFLDSDILVLHSLEPVFAELEKSSVLLSLHTTTPGRGPAGAQIEVMLLYGGVYNGGFLGIKRSKESHQFIDWFAERLAILSFEHAYGVFVDQLWLNLAPLFFPGVRVITHPGVNVGYWNVHERVIQRNADGIYLSNDEPLLFTHFSRWQIQEPDQLTAGRPLAPGTDPKALVDLGRLYRKLLMKNGYEACRVWSYSYGRFSNGEAITPAVRRYYYDVVIAGKAPKGSPFEMPEYFDRELSARKVFQRHFKRVIRMKLGKWKRILKRSLSRA